MLIRPVGEWQSLDVTSEERGGSYFYEFCDLLQTSANGTVNDTPEGAGFETAYTNWSDFYRMVFLPAGCQSSDFTRCIDESFETYRGISVGNDDRAWMWTVCSELGWFQTGPPRDLPEVPAIVSRYLDVAAWESICQYAFPEAFGSTSTDSINATAQVEAANSRVDLTSQKLKGWKSTADRLFVVNGARDPWLEVTWSTSLPLSQTDLPPSTNASSELLIPRFEGYTSYDGDSNTGSSTRNSDDTTGNGLFPSSPTRPIYLTDGFHCSDMQAVNAGADESIARVWVDVAERFGEWVEGFEVGWTEVDGEGGAATGLRASGRVGVIWVIIAVGIFGIFWL
ncbi:endoprotease [Coprinopsis cinerea AmutBmut pab1-1]|nr:endoprotease [Coprinopsis cinerea AmutBmut pab1-1]